MVDTAVWKALVPSRRWYGGSTSTAMVKEI
jgi:hypothetical protein